MNESRSLLEACIEYILQGNSLCTHHVNERVWLSCKPNLKISNENSITRPNLYWFLSYLLDEIIAYRTVSYTQQCSYEPETLNLDIDFLERLCAVLPAK